MPITRCNAAGFQILLGLALLVASIAMLSPGEPEQPLLFPGEDKLWHLLTFAVLAFLADAGWPDKGFVPLKYLPLCAYGIGIEILTGSALKSCRTTSPTDNSVSTTWLPMAPAYCFMGPWLSHC